MHVSHPCPSAEQAKKRMSFMLHREVSPQTACLHSLSTKMMVQFPELRLIEYDCGKLQTLDILLHRLKSGSHRVLIFTQMTKMLDVLEAFLSYHGHRYLRLDGTTKVEQRQALMDRFNMDRRIFCFILSTRSGGIGVNLTGADTVIFYDSDWNPTMDAQAQDRCHRIGQTRDVHIYRLISERTIEENILKKANQKRLLGDLAIEGGNFTTAFFKEHTIKELFEEPSGLDALAKEKQAQAALKQGKELHKEPPKKLPEGETNVLAQFEQALCKAEDETDAIAVKLVKAEQKAELAEFDETIPWDEKEAESKKDEEVSKVELELAQLDKELTPIERYAVCVMEAEMEPETIEELMIAEEDIENSKKEWELARLKALKEEEERRLELEEDEMLYTYSRDDAYNQVKKKKKTRLKKNSSYTSDDLDSCPESRALKSSGRLHEAKEKVKDVSPRSQRLRQKSGDLKLSGDETIKPNLSPVKEVKKVTPKPKPKPAPKKETPKATKKEAAKITPKVAKEPRNTPKEPKSTPKEAKSTPKEPKEKTPKVPKPKKDVKSVKKEVKKEIKINSLLTPTSLPMAVNIADALKLNSHPVPNAHSAGVVEVTANPTRISCAAAATQQVVQPLIQQADSRPILKVPTLASSLTTSPGGQLTLPTQGNVIINTPQGRAIVPHNRIVITQGKAYAAPQPIKVIAGPAQGQVIVSSPVARVISPGGATLNSVISQMQTRLVAPVPTQVFNNTPRIRSPINAKQTPLSPKENSVPPPWSNPNLVIRTRRASLQEAAKPPLPQTSILGGGGVNLVSIAPAPPTHHVIASPIPGVAYNIVKTNSLHVPILNNQAMSLSRHQIIQTNLNQAIPAQSFVIVNPKRTRSASQESNGHPVNEIRDTG